MIEAKLAQRGRALIDYHAGFYRAGGGPGRRAAEEMTERGITNDTMPDDMDERHRLVETTMADSKAFRVSLLIGEWGAKAHGQACQEAFEEIRQDVEPSLLALDDGPTTLEYAPDLKPPAYWSKVWFHRTHGGWDAGDYNGFVHGELVHKRLVGKNYPGDIFAQRRAAAREAPKETYRRILEVGTSSGHYTQALAEAYPEAEIWGVDLSPRMLEHARRVANDKGLAWKLFVRAGEDTGFEAESFDLVTSYIVLHEQPARAIKACFEEAFRLLEPGGDLLTGDVPRYWDQDKMTSWRADWNARFGGEPYWRSSATMDQKACAEAIGFVDVETYALGPNLYPFILRARKPG